MPVLNISTNVTLDGVVTSKMLNEISMAISSITGKPEAYVMVLLKGALPIAFGGSEEPAVYAELVALGGLTPEINKKLSSLLAEFFKRNLSVSPSRFYIKFFDMPHLESVSCLHALHQ